MGDVGDVIADMDEGGNLSIWLLGGFRVSSGSRVVEEGEWRLRKAKSLVKLLALSPDHRLHREQVMETLWPDSDADTAARNFRKVLHYARRALDAPGADSSRFVQTQGEMVALRVPGSLWIDVEAFEAAATRAMAHSGEQPVAYVAAIELYAGDLLPEDRYEDWTAGRREELRGKYLRLLARVARAYELAGDVQAAVEAFRRAVAAEPLNEEAHRDLMRVLAAAGQRHEALQQYRHLEDVLKRELDNEPEEATRRLFHEITAGRLLPEDWPITRPVVDREQRSARKHNLPAQLTSFIGRLAELAEVKRLLGAGRLLTLTGPGGCGKTRLALEAATQIVGEYRDGVWLVELAGLAEPALVPQAVASALGVREQPHRPLPETLTDYLYSKRLLLVLDNCEHLVEVCAQLAETLLQACADIEMLVTSRESLGIRGETAWLVPSLSLPGASDMVVYEKLARSEAVQLFIQRAEAAVTSFALTAHNAGHVGQVCRRLDGIPLAIELAAARAKVLSVEQIANRLDRSFEVLAGGSRTALPRQQTLKATIDWSYNLLSEGERTLFRRLSVFAGGFTLEAGEAVCDFRLSIFDSGPKVLELLSRLVDKSLVGVVEAESGGDVRYRLLETLRQYGGEKLAESGEGEETRRGHAHYFAGLCTQADPELRARGQLAWLDRLSAEMDNLRAALAWCREHDAAMGLQMAGAIWRFWEVRGYFAEGRRWIDALLPLAPERTRTRGKALYASGHLATRQGHSAQAVLLLEESTDIFRELDDRDGEGMSLERLGLTIALQGDYDRGMGILRQSLAILRQGGDRAALGWVLASLGMLSRTRVENDYAAEVLEESLPLLRELGDAHGIAYALNNLGQLARVNHEYGKAWDLLEECLELSRRMENKPFTCWSLECLSTVARMRGDYRNARILLEKALVVAREVGLHRHLARCMWSFGVLASKQGVYMPGVRLISVAVQLYSDTALRASLDEDERQEWNEGLEAARSALGEEEYERAWSEGQAMSVDEAIEHVLEALPMDVVASDK